MTRLIVHTTYHNRARPNDVTEGYAADLTAEQLREPAQRIADRVDMLMGKRGIIEKGELN